MNVSRRRKLGGLFGGVLVLLAAGAVALIGHPLVETPILAIQVLLMGLAGVFDIVASTDTRLTARWAWYRWSGVGNILLGLSLPLGFVGTDSGLFLVVVTGLGGLSLAAMGIDLAVFHGQYTRGQYLSRKGA